MNEEKKKLQPCPFCGGEAIMKIQRHIPKGYEYTPTCKNTSCAGRLTKKWLTEAEAIEAWNRRAETTVETLMRVFAYDATCGVCDKRKERTAKVIDKSVGRHSISDFDWIGKCEKCGNEIQYSFDFCPYCGAELEWSE